MRILILFFFFSIVFLETITGHNTSVFIQVSFIVNTDVDRTITWSALLHETPSISMRG